MRASRRPRHGNSSRKPASAQAKYTWNSWPATALPAETRGCAWSPWPTWRSLQGCRHRAQAATRPERTGCRSTETGPLAFDHGQILADGLERARAKLEYTPLAAAFCPPEFTIAQLRGVYETVWGTSLDPRNFHRKVTGTPGFVIPACGETAGARGRPAQLYRKGPAATLYPPLLRP